MMEKASIFSEPSSETTSFDKTKDTLDLWSDTDSIPNPQDANNTLDKLKYECEDSGKCLSSSIDKKTDLIVHTTDKSFKCEVCNKCFSKKPYLNRHYFVHSNERPFQCDSCESSFKDPNNLKNHRRTQHSNVKPYSCDLCDKSFSRRRTLRLHYVSHTDQREKRTKINLCNKYSKLGSEMRKSTESSIFTNEKKASILKNEVQKVSSDQSGEPANEKFSLIERFRSYDGEYEFRCIICNRGYNNKNSLYGHYRSHKESFTCEVCNKTFNLKTSLARHFLTHTGERPFQCDDCNKSFATTHEMRKHCRIHTNERPYKCDICDEDFRESGALKKHYFRHVPEKPFKCIWCPKQFLWQSKLDKHYVSHLKNSEVSNKNMKQLSDSESSQDELDSKVNKCSEIANQ